MASTPSPSASGATVPSEWSLLLAALALPSSKDKSDRIDVEVQSAPPWARVLDLADRHGVGPLLYQAISGSKDRVPPAVMRALSERYQVNLHKSLFLARELIRILEQLRRFGIETLPYKGITLGEVVYGDIALRQAGDIDLLIRPVDLAGIKAAVLDLGYTSHIELSPAEERAYLRAGYECAFDSPAGRNLLEVQWAIQPRFYAVDLEMEELFRRSVTVTVAGHTMQTLSREDQILVLSVHAAKHVWGRMIWLCDIARIMGSNGLRWDWIQEQANTLGIARILRVTLLVVNQLLGSPIAASLKANVLADREALAIASEVRSQILRDEACSVESADYFRLMMRLRERRADRMRFLWRLVLTPGPNEWRAVRLPAPLFPLYRLVRLSRLVARLGRA